MLKFEETEATPAGGVAFFKKATSRAGVPFSFSVIELRPSPNDGDQESSEGQEKPQDAVESATAESEAEATVDAEATLSDDADVDAAVFDEIVSDEDDGPGAPLTAEEHRYLTYELSPPHLHLTLTLQQQIVPYAPKDSLARRLCTRE